MVWAMQRPARARNDALQLDVILLVILLIPSGGVDL